MINSSIEPRIHLTTGLVHVCTLLILRPLKTEQAYSVPKVLESSRRSTRVPMGGSLLTMNGRSQIYSHSLNDGITTVVLTSSPF